jgi:hypothetical protein
MLITDDKAATSDMLAANPSKKKDVAKSKLHTK